MKWCVVAFLLGAVLGCAKFSPFAFQTDQAVSSIDQHQDGFFILRYLAYRGSHRLGGTLNEVSIRNLSSEPLKVESLSFLQVFRGRQVTVDNAPIPYEGMNGSILSGATPTTHKDIAPGEWMSFDFPTKDISEFAEGDKMHVTFSVSLMSGALRYERKFEFTKTLVKSKLPSS